MRDTNARGLRAAILAVTSAIFGSMLVAAATDSVAQTPDAVIAEGLAAWRKPNARGAACANCHGPDGFEIARFGFSDDDIRRRDAIHVVAPAESDRVVAMIHAIRDKYQLNAALLDPMDDRPFQPGGQFIVGATSQERDYNTALHTFAPKLPTLFNERVDSILKALQARDEVLSFDLRNERIGVPFPRLSESVARGRAHGSLNDWFTELPRTVKPESEAAWYALHDAYLAQPSEANLWAIVNAVDVYTANPAGASSNAVAYSAAKYKSLLIGQHLLREQVLGHSAPSALLSRRPIVFLEVPETPGDRTRIHNPMFAVGSHAHRSRPRASDFPPDVLGALNAKLGAQLDQMALPWWYLAWTFNPGLPDIAGRLEHFPPSVEGRPDGESYPIHHQFVRIKMDMTQAYAPYVRIAGQPPQVNELKLGDAALGFDYADVAAIKLFFNDAHRQLHRTFTANIRRMQLYLLLNEFNKQCADDRPYVDVVGDEVSFVESLRTSLLPELERLEPAHAAENRALVDDVIRRLAEAWNRCAPLPQAGGGAGLFAELFDDINLSKPLGFRIDPRLNFVYTTMAPDAGAGVSIRWTGELEPRFSEVYEISVKSGQHTESGFRLWVDGQLLIDNWDGSLVKGRTIGRGGDRHFGADVALQSGMRHAFRLEYRERSAKQSIQLMWKSARQLPEIIPQSQLYPGIELGARVFVPTTARAR